jgi:hypothetical protein
VLAPRVGRDLVQRPRPVERVERDEVVEAVRANLLQRLAHSLGLELEDPDAVAGGEHRIGRRVVERQRCHVGTGAGRALDDVERVLDHVEVAQAEEIHFQQADLLDRLHRELRHGAELALAVLVEPSIGELERNDVGQRPIRDHHGGGVNRGVANDALEAASGVDDRARRRVLVVGRAQQFAVGETLLEGRRTALLRIGDQLREAVADAVVVPEHARGVARRLARRHLAEGDDLRNRLAAVLLDDIAQHALAAAHGEVDVDVRHRNALGVQEALEQEVVGQRVDVRDPQAVGDDRAGGRTASRAHGDPAALGEVDEVPHDQEVGVEAHPVDHLELGLHAGQRRGGRRVAVALAQALLDESAQVAARRLAVGHRIGRDQLAVELELHVAALGDLERGGERLRPLRERLRHLGAVAQIELVGLEADLRLGQCALGLHAEQRRVVLIVLAAQVMDIAGPDQRAAHLARQCNDLLVAALLQRQPVLLDLEIHVLAPERPDQRLDVLAALVDAPIGDP